MSIPGPKCIRSIELHGTICIPPEEWEKVKAVIQEEIVGDCSGCYLTLHVNEHGNLALACVNSDGCRGGEECCLEIEYMEGRGHRAHCRCKRMD